MPDPADHRGAAAVSGVAGPDHSKAVVGAFGVAAPTPSGHIQAEGAD